SATTRSSRSSSCPRQVAQTTARSKARGHFATSLHRSGLRRVPSRRLSTSPTRLRELRERIEQLRAQLEALPIHRLRRIEHFEERARTLSTQREQLAEELARLPKPRRRFGREHDPGAIERAYLTSALEGHDRELQAIVGRGADLERELGDPAEIRAERDG